MTTSLVVCPKPSLSPGSGPYSSVTVTGSCVRVASSVARYILVSSSITCSLTSRKSPLAPSEDILGRGENSREEIHSSSWGQPGGNQRPGGRGRGPLAPAQPGPVVSTAFSRLALPPPGSDTSLRCKLKSPSWKLVTDTPAKLFSGMAVLAWGFLVSVMITCPLVRRRIREEV